MAHSPALEALLRDPRWVSGELDLALSALLETASAALDASRVAVWWLEDDGIRTDLLYDAREDAWLDGGFLGFDAAPAYFDALRTKRLVRIDDAQHDVRTAGFNDAYLVPTGIGALVDAPILVGGRLVGVVCHEHVGGPRQWTESDCTFAASIGDLAALAIETAGRREAEHALLQREREVRVAMEAAGVADWGWDIAANEVRWSPGIARMFGQPEGWAPDSLDGFLDLVHPDDREPVQQRLTEAVASGDDYYVEHRTCEQAGRVRWLEGRGRIFRDEHGQAIAIAGVVADVTERHELQERVRRAERLDSLGRLAGGVAHDFNNLLTAIVGAADILAEEELPDGGSELVELICGSAERAAELTRRLLAFGRRQPHDGSASDLGSMVSEMQPLLTSVLGETVRLDLDVDADCPVRSDMAELQRVVMNLAINGRDAMPDGGTLRVGVQRGPGTVELTVQDEGTGIAPQVMERMFEPYFSTKHGSQGTGLGLAVVHGIVDQLGGRIDVTSSPGQGATFVVTLPLAADDVPHASSQATARRTPPVNLDVLLVEDEPAVASLLSRLLGAEGHRVTHVDNGQDAQDALEAGAPDVLICDVVLPGVSGPQVVLAARARHPELPVVMMTGYAPEDLPPELAQIPLLMKPFHPHELLRRLAEVLAASE